MNIPLPYGGYWVKIKYGKPANRIFFEEDFEGKDEIIFRPTLEENQNKIPVVSAQMIRQKEIEGDKRINLKIPQKLINPDPLIAKYKENLDLRKKYPDNYSIGYENHLDIRVTGAQHQRAILIMDTLIKAMKCRGHDVHINDRLVLK